MIWSEKIWFVKESKEYNYFNTSWFGWCDIGYFRNELTDLNTNFLKKWPDLNKISPINKNQIIYSCINNNTEYIKLLFNIIKNKNKFGLPNLPIPPDQNSIAGGFFILDKDKIDWWCQIYNSKLELYFKHNYLVKDDQVIIVDCIFSNLDHFKLYYENNLNYNNWFMFQRILN
jgi:hypothetical protein